MANQDPFGRRQVVVAFGRIGATASAEHAFEDEAGLSDTVRHALLGTEAQRAGSASAMKRCKPRRRFFLFSRSSASPSARRRRRSHEGASEPATAAPPAICSCTEALHVT